MTTFAPTALRASELVRCTRMAALRGLGAEQAEHDAQTIRFFARGHLYTDYVCRQLEAKHGKDAIEREAEIPWPHGIGHADAYVKPEKLLVEIKSTVSPLTSSPMFDMAVAQLRFYLRFHPEAEQGALYLINPSDLSAEDVYAVNLTDEDRDEIDAAVTSLGAALEGGPLPQRVCSQPGQARGRLCSFAEACFEGWAPPEPNSIVDPEVAEVVSRLVAIKRQAAPVKEQLDALEQARKDAQAELSELVEVGESVVGPWLVKRTHVSRQPSFSLKAFRAAGHSVEPLAEFFKPGAEYDTFSVAPAEAAGSLDFGEDAPF